MLANGTSHAGRWAAVAVVLAALSMGCASVDRVHRRAGGGAAVPEASSPPAAEVPAAADAGDAALPADAPDAATPAPATPPSAPSGRTAASASGSPAAGSVVDSPAAARPGVVAVPTPAVEAATRSEPPATASNASGGTAVAAAPAAPVASGTAGEAATPAASEVGGPRRVPRERARDAARERADARSPSDAPAREDLRERRPVRDRPSGDAVVSVSAEPGFVRVGDAVTVRIRIAGGDDVGSVPFHLRYDPTVLRYDGADEGPFLGADGRDTAFLAAPGSSGERVVVGLSRLGPGDGAGGDGELCVLRFTAIGTGDARLAFDRAKVRDSLNRIAPARFETATVQVR